VLHIWGFDRICPYSILGSSPRFPRGPTTANTGYLVTPGLALCHYSQVIETDVNAVGFRILLQDNEFLERTHAVDRNEQEL